MNMATRGNPFAQLWALGYQRLVPIIPPDAVLSPTSSLAKARDPRGKAVGIKRGENWSGYDWVKYECDELDTQRWFNMGAGAGIKTGRGLIAIDADTLVTESAVIIRDLVREHLGDTPIRVGQSPKALYLVRVDDDYPYTKVEFGERRENGTLIDRVEILTEGKQFVAYGIHPKTLKPYSWPRPLLPFDTLPVFKTGQIDALMAAIQQAMPAATPVSKTGSAAPVSQESLKGSLEAITKAVRATPNTSDAFPSREDYLDMGYAIKGALQDHPREAFELYADWCGRWIEGTNDPSNVASDWSRMKGPFKMGASMVFDLAEAHSGGAFKKVDAWFDNIDIVEVDNPFAIARAREEASAPGGSIKATPYAFPDPASVKPRQWLYGNHYIRKFVSATVAPSGVGKSSLEIVEALAMASGKPLLGITPKGKFRVWLWNGEDPRDELDRRILAAMRHYGLSPEDIEDRLFIDSGRDMEIVLATETRGGAVIAMPVVEAVMKTIRENRIDVMQIDPFVSSHRVSENDNGAIDMVSKRWAKIADQCDCAIELVHHVRKLNGSEITVEDSRGAVSLIATSRSARALTKMTAKEAGLLGIENHWRYFRFGDGKNNLAPPVDVSTSWMELKSVGLANGLAGAGDASTSAPVSGADMFAAAGDMVGVVCRCDVGALLENVGGQGQQEALRLVSEGLWRRDIRAGDDWCGIPIGRALGLDYTDEAEKEQLKAIIKGWVKSGLLVEFSQNDASRRRRTYVRVAEIEDKLSENVFD